MLENSERYFQASAVPVKNDAESMKENGLEFRGRRKFLDKGSRAGKQGIRKLMIDSWGAGFVVFIAQKVISLLSILR